MKFFLLQIFIQLIFCQLSFAEDKNTSCHWIHYKSDVSIGEVHATLNRHRLIANKIYSNPFRAQICQNLNIEKQAVIKTDLYVQELNNNDSPIFKNHYYSTFGFTREQRDYWSKSFMIAVPTSLIIFGSAVWDWGENGAHMGFGNEGWFDKNSYTGGADKLGHMTSLYMEKRFTTWLALQSGHDMKTAQRYGLYTAAFIGISLEIGDGFSKYKFSTEDLFMDSIGIAFAWLLDEYPFLDELMGIRWEWWPSSEYRDSRNKEKTDITSDYSGQRVYLSLKTSGMPYLRENTWSRYLTLDFGFYTRGYEPDLTPNNPYDNIKRRYCSVGIGINLGTLIFDANPDSTAVRTAGSLTKYWIPPGVSQILHREEL